jgi:hypothetical protein
MVVEENVELTERAGAGVRELVGDAGRDDQDLTGGCLDRVG